MNIQDKFLAYLEGELSEKERSDFEAALKNSAELEKDYREFVKTFNVLKSMKEEKKAPVGFEVGVMKAISLVNNRSSIMTTISLFFSKNLNRKILIPLAPALAGIVAITLIIRSNSSLDSRIDYREVKPSSQRQEEQKPAKSFPEAPIDQSLSEAHVKENPKLIVEEFPKPAVEQNLANEIPAVKDEADYLEPFGPPLREQLSAVAPLPPVEVKAKSGNLERRKSLETTQNSAVADGKHRVMSQGIVAGAAPSYFADYEVPTAVYNTEQYNATVENGFQNAKSTPLSTFSIDVDTASYSNIRRFLNRNQLPPKDAVRTEEMLNYFKYDYTAPQSKEVPFTVSTELSKAPWSEKHQLLHIGLKGYEEDLSKLPASNLVFLIDVSGSMESPEKLPLLKQGLRLLVEQLRSEDRVALVVYAGAAGVVLDSKSGSQKQEILSAIENLQAGGSTAGGAGIELAYKIAKSHFIENGNNRIILATDGDFNVGISSDEELVKVIEEKRKTGIFLSILGFGMGNYKDGKMEQLANKGNGNYAYIDNIHEAKKVLVNDFRGTIFAIANDVKIQIEFNPAYVQAYRLIGYENRLLNKEDFNDDRKDAGELGAGHSVTALYEIVPTGVAFNSTPSVDALKYQQVVSPTPEAKVNLVQNGELATVKLRYKLPNEDTSKLISQVVNSNPSDAVSNNFKFAASVAQFGMLLRDSEHKGNATLESTLKLAQESKGADELGYRAEFIKLVETAKLLSK